MEFIFEKYNYLIVIILMLTGLFIVFSRGNLIKTLIGLNIFQTSVFIFYITIGKVAAGTAPILLPEDLKSAAHHGDDHAVHGTPEAGHSSEKPHTDAHQASEKPADNSMPAVEDLPIASAEDFAAGNDLQNAIDDIEQKATGAHDDHIAEDLHDFELEDGSTSTDVHHTNIIDEDLKNDTALEEDVQHNKTYQTAPTPCIDQKDLSPEDAVKSECLPADYKLQLSDVDHESMSPKKQQGHHAKPHHAELKNAYSNPLPHVLILTAIVVGVATTSVGLALAVRIREAYGTIEEDELEIADEIAEYGGMPPEELLAGIPEDVIEKARADFNLNKPQRGRS